MLFSKVISKQVFKGELTMIFYRCKMCGGTIEFENKNTIGTCDSCGTKQTLPKTKDEMIANLFNRANNLRLKCEFDKAAQIYEKILEQDDSEAEAHWGMVLCKYGIEYVEDPKTFKRIPTCHRTVFQAILADCDYKSAIDCSDLSQKIIYESEARAIDLIQKDILAIVKNEEPFDVFICYKEKDENGKRTMDSAIANDIYYQLTQEGFKVFFAAITLEEKLGQEYEPYIFAALNSAKVMLAIGTKPEYFSSVWVKNEWSRYLQLMKSNCSKLLIPCYRDMDAYDLPEEFAHLQAQDMGKIGFVNDIIRGIKKVIQRDESSKETAKETVVDRGKANTASLLKRVFMFLEDGNWNSANEYCERVLDIDPENAEAYLGKLLSELKVRKQENLKDQVAPFDDNNNYQKAIRFADDKLKNILMDCIAYINTRNENTRLEATYTRAKKAMSTASVDSVYNEIAHIFESIHEYKDSAVLAEECYDKAERARKNEILDKGKAKMTGELISNYEAAIKLFETISGWEDADEKVCVCQNKIEEIKVKEEIAENARKEKVKRIAKRKRIVKAIITFSACVTAFLLLLFFIIIPSINRKNTIEKFGNDFVAEFENLNVGDVFAFGEYEQDNNIDNGKEPILWVVAESDNNRKLLVSKYAIDCRPYNSNDGYVTWESSSIRKWLNDNFLCEAFNADEQSLIDNSVVSADDNSHFDTNAGKDTKDRVFLLSIEEANKYFYDDKSRICGLTNYVASKNPRYFESGICWWWLRTPGAQQNTAAAVNHSGGISVRGDIVNSELNCIRPALWIDLNF